MLERLARDKHASLLRKSVNYSHKKFLSTGPYLGFVAEGGQGGAVTAHRPTTRRPTFRQLTTNRQPNSSTQLIAHRHLA
jgi:hypothetical protein